MIHQSRKISLSLLLVLGFWLLASASTPVDGVSVLLLLSEPYGANTGLLWNNFERLGWDVTVAGVSQEMRNCSWLTTPIDVDATVEELPHVSSFDVVVISPTPGGFQSLPFPAEDLRTNPQVLDLLQTADDMGLVMYAGCAGLFVLGDAGVLEGHDVVCHSTARNECSEYGASCTTGSFSQPPRFDDNIVTGTNQRYFALEIPEAIAHALDASLSRVPSIDAFEWVSLDLVEGATEWDLPGKASTVGTEYSDLAYAVCPMTDGFAVVGSTSGGGQGSMDLLLVRLDEAGEVLWSRAFGGPGRDYGEAVCVAPGGDLVVAGYTTSTGSGLEDLLVLRVNPHGQLIWSSTFGGRGADTGTGICTTQDGGLVVCGRTESFDAARSDVYVVKIDAHGNELWTAIVGGSRYDRAHAIREMPNGTLIVGGGTTSLGRGNYDLYLVALSPTGETIWEKTYGLGEYDIAEDLIITSDGGMVVTGYGDQESRDPNNVVAVRYDAHGEQEWAKRLGVRKAFEYGEGIVELPDGDLLICGATTYPSTGRNDALLLRIDPSGTTVWSMHLGQEVGNEWASAICELASGQFAVVGHTLAEGAGGHDLLLMLLDPDEML